MGVELAKEQKYTNKENLHIIKPTTELVHFPKLKKNLLQVKLSSAGTRRSRRLGSSSDHLVLEWEVEKGQLLFSLVSVTGDCK